MYNCTVGDSQRNLGIDNKTQYTFCANYTDDRNEKNIRNGEFGSKGESLYLKCESDVPCSRAGLVRESFLLTETEMLTKEFPRPF